MLLLLFSAATGMLCFYYDRTSKGRDIMHETAEQERAKDIQQLAFGGTVMLGLCAAFALFFHKTLTSRVTQLLSAAERLAQGDLSVRVGLVGGDELTLIARAFDQMASQMQRRESALGESEQLFRQMAESVEEIFWLYDFQENRVLYVNPAFERIFGLPVAAFLKTSDVWKNAIHPQDRDWVLAVFAKEKDGPRDIEYRILRSDGSVRWLRDSTFPILSAGSSVTRVAGVAEDITRRRADAEEKAALENKLQETQRLESLGVLAGGIAHDFNNLLTGVMGNASLARMVLPPDDDAQKYLTEIEAVALRAADLCKQMLAYSGKGRFEVQLLDLSALVKETTQLLQLSISKTATLHFNLPAQLPAVLADPTQFRQVVMNLVINASEALGGKVGTISLQTNLLHVDSDYLASTVLASELAEGDYITLEIADNGQGMSAETQARIFDPFFTTKFTGRGLGLSAVLGIVRGHKGALKVYSEIGKGTTFKLLFPVAKGQAKSLHREPDIIQDWRGTGTILVVDDEDTVRTVAARILQSFGFKVITACDGQDAIEQFISARSEIVAVLMDLTMPNVDGEEAFRHLRLLQPDLRVLLMSGFNEQEAINRFIGKGLAGFLQKPFKPSELRTKLRDMLG